MKRAKLTMEALIFDSGVGGLSILREILKLRPELSFVYLADTAGLPYGDKAESWLLERILAVLDVALRQFEPRLLVIACNTASTLALEAIRTQVAIPVVGVVPAIKPAAALTQNQVIGLLATPATVQRPYTDRLIRDFAPQCRVIRLGSLRLVEIAEKKVRGEKFSLDEIETILQPFLRSAPIPDTLVLGCTHFPLLCDELHKLLPAVKLVDSGAAIAQRVDGLLGALNPGPSPHKKILFTQWDEDLAKLRPYLQKMGLEESQELFGAPSRKS